MRTFMYQALAKSPKSSAKSASLFRSLMATKLKSAKGKVWIDVCESWGNNLDALRHSTAPVVVVLRGLYCAYSTLYWPDGQLNSAQGRAGQRLTGPEQDSPAPAGGCYRLESHSGGKSKRAYSRPVGDHSFSEELNSGQTDYQWQSAVHLQGAVNARLPGTDHSHSAGQGRGRVGLVSQMSQRSLYRFNAKLLQKQHVFFIIVRYTLSRALMAVNMMY